MTEPNIYDLFKEAERRLSEKAPGYTIRQANLNDIDKVIGINMVSLPEHYPRGFYEELLEKWGKAFYVAVDPRGDIVGYVMNRVERKPGFFKYFLVKSGHIVSLAVLQEHRQRGLGYALMAYSMKTLYEDYDCNETYLEVRVSNRPAISLYERLGYKIVKVEKGYYLDGEDAYVMARRLP